VGFGDNDHAIRGLMRFIEMTSRELRIKDVEMENPQLQMLTASNSKEV
jgi:hypothetical protein